MIINLVVELYKLSANEINPIRAIVAVPGIDMSYFVMIEIFALWFGV